MNPWLYYLYLLFIYLLFMFWRSLARSQGTKSISLAVYWHKWNPSDVIANKPSKNRNHDWQYTHGDSWYMLDGTNGYMICANLKVEDAKSTLKIRRLITTVQLARFVIRCVIRSYAWDSTSTVWFNLDGCFLSYQTALIGSMFSNFTIKWKWSWSSGNG